jgi:hypothetical protein
VIVAVAANIGSVELKLAFRRDSHLFAPSLPAWAAWIETELPPGAIYCSEWLLTALD